MVRAMKPRVETVVFSYGVTMKALGVLATGILFGTGCSIAQTASALPKEVAAAVDAQKKICEKPVHIDPGFVQRRDINADGIPDYILDYGKLQCGGPIFCGSSGCLTQVFVSLPDGSAAKVLDRNVESISFKKEKGFPAMQVKLHGSFCGKVGVEPCGMTLYWNGDSFTPAH